MSMYKTIFVTEETDLQSGEQVFTINGEVSLYGDSAFSSLNDAVSKVATVDTNAVVIKVASGKYDSYVVINNGVAGSATAVSEVVAVNFGGGEVMSGDSKVAVAAANFTAEEQTAVLTLLNTQANPGTVYVAAGTTDLAPDANLLVTSGAANYVSGDSSFVVSGNTVTDIVGVVSGANNTAVVEDTETDAKTLEYDAEAGVYWIKSVEDLKTLAAEVNGGNKYSGKTVKVADDVEVLDLNSEEWTAIGTDKDHAFEGTFDGNGVTIKNLVITGDKSNQGLFGFTQNGELKNFTLTNAKVSGYLNVGAVAGTPYTSKLNDITVNGLVEINGFAYVGGVGGKNAYADWNNVHVKADADSYVNGDSIDGDAAYRTYVGGVIGFMGEGGHKFSNISSNIDVIGSVCDVGGIAGMGHYGNNFENVTCTGTVTNTNTNAEDSAETGGIVGVWHNQAGTTVTITNGSFSGTIVGGTAEITESLKNNSVAGSAYNADELENAGKGQLSVIEETVKDGSVSIKVSVIGGTAAEREDAVKDILGVTELPAANEDGSYSGTEKYVAKIGTAYYTSLKAAVDAAVKGQTIKLLGSDTQVEANVSIFNGKDLTFTGDAGFYWDKDWFFIGRGGNVTDANMTTVTFNDATIKSLSDSSSLGFHVSGEEKNTGKKNDTLNIINGSDIVTDYMINKGTVKVDDSKITIKNGFSNGGRPGSETPSGNDGTAYFVASNNSTVVINNHNGQGIGYEANGVFSLDDSALKVETKGENPQPANLLNTAKGVTVLAGDSDFSAATFTNEGKLVFGNYYDLKTKKFVSKAYTGDFDATIAGTGLIQVAAGELNITKDITTGNFAVGDTYHASFSAGEKATVNVTAGEHKITGTGDTATYIGYADDTDFLASNKGKFTLNISGDGTIWDGGSTHVANAGQINVTDKAKASFTYTKVRGGLTVDDATVDITSAMNVYGENNYVDGTKESGVIVGTAEFKVLNGAVVNSTGNLVVGKEGNANRVGIVTVNNSSLSYGKGVTIYSGSSIEITDGIFSAETISNAGTINLTVSAQKFATVTEGAYTIVNQTADGGMVTDGMIVSVAGTNRLVGESWEIGDVTYSLTNGDGNDIILKAQADTLTVDADAQANGFNVFNTVTDAIVAAGEQGGATIDLTDEAYSGKNIGETVANGLFLKNGTYTFTNGNYTDFVYVDTPRPSAENAGLVDVNIVFDNAKAVVNKFRLDNGSSLTITNSHVDANNTTPTRGWTTFYGDSTIDITNSVVGWDIYDQGNSDHIVAGDKDTVYANASTQAGAMCFAGSGVMKVEDSTIFAYTTEDGNYSAYSVYDKGLMSFKDSAVYGRTIRVGVANDNKTVGRDDEVATMVFDNSVLRNINGDNAPRIFVGDGANTAGKLLIENGSVIEYAGAAMTVNNNGYVEITDSTVNVGAISNDRYIDIADSSVSAKNITKIGRITANGTVNLNFDELTDTQLFVGRTYDSDGKAVMNEERSVVNLNSISGNGITATTARFNFNNADLNLKDNLVVTVTDKMSLPYVYMKNTAIDLGGKQMNVNGAFVMNSIQLYSGTLVINVNAGKAGATSNFGADGGLIASNAKMTVQDGPFGFYADTTINGEFTANNIANGINLGANDTVWGIVEDAVVTVSGANAKFTTDGNVQVHKYDTSTNPVDYQYGILESSLIIENGATAVIGGKLTNDGTVTVDASSSFSAGSIVNNGTFNSETAGEMIVLGDITVTGNVETEDLVVKAGAALSAGSITVDNLTLEIGGSLNLTGTGSEVKTFTVTGELNPENAEFTLVTSGWDTDFANSISFGGVTYTWNGTDKYLDGATLEQGEFYFTVDGGKLYVAKQTEEIGGIYIGNIDNKIDGDKITVDGFTYTVGKDAFANAEEATNGLTEDVKAAVTTITIDKDYSTDDDKVKVLLDEDHFKNVNTIRVSKAGVVVDTSGAVETAGSLTLENDGHFEANLQVNGDFTFTNTSDQTLTGEISAEYIEGINTGTITGQTFTAENGIVIDNTNGNINNSTLNSTLIDITGGDASNVTVKTADPLNLTDTNSFGLNAVDSDVYRVNLIGSANLSVDGDNNSIDTEISADTDHTGTLTLNGNQTYGDSADLSANKIVIAAGMNVTISGTADSKELEIAGTLNTAFDDMSNFTSAGDVTGTGVLNTTHTGDWVVNDSVVRDFSGFTGTVEMGKDNASIVLGKGDAINGAAAKESYFSDNATVTVKDTQSVVLAGNGVNTGIDFNGSGVLNVGNYDNGFADGSDGFTQTLTGNNDGFTGTVNVSEGAELTIENALGASAIQLDYNANTGVTGDADDTKLILNKEGLELGAVITGDANDVIDVKENATLTGTGALNNFAGTVNVADSKALTLNGVNTTSAEFVGGETTVVNVNANNTLTADNTDFVGTVNIGTDSTLTLQGDLSSDEKGTVNFTDKASKLDLTADEAGEVITIGAKLDNSALASGFLSNVVNVNSNAELTAEGALNNYRGKIDIDADTTLTLSGNNTTQTNLQGSGTLALADGADVIELTLRNDRLLSGTPAGNSLLNFNGTFAVNDNKLNILTYTQTGASFTGTGDAELNINKFTVPETGKSYQGSLTLNAAGALNGFDGSVNLTESTLDVKAENTTNAVFTGDVKSNLNISDVLTLNTADAVSDFNGTVKLYNSDDALVLKGENSTAATLTGTGVVYASANQVFTGDVTGFTGNFDIAADKEVQLTGTFADADNKVVNAFGGTLTLADKDVEVQVNAGTNTLNTVNFGNNSLTVGTGDFVNVNGTGSVVFADAHNDNAFTSLVAKDVKLTGGRNITATDFDGNLHITISVADDGTADLTTDSAFGRTIYVTIDNSALLTGNDYNVIEARGGYNINSIQLTIGSVTETLYLNDSVKLDGFTYSLRNKAGVWVIDQRAGASNFVVVNGAWGIHKYDSVNDNGTDRAIGFDAAKNLDNAVEYIRGYSEGQGWEAVTGAGKIELTAGKYTLTDGKYLMTDTNKVSLMTLAARDGEAASLRGDIYASENAGNTLTLENVQLIGNLFGNGNVVIANSDAATSSGRVVAGGVGTGSITKASSVTLKGGVFNTSYIVGGSFTAEENAFISVSENTSVTINNTDATKALIVSGSIYGGSFAYGISSDIMQTGDASVTINATNAVTIRGNIYISGDARNGILEMTGDGKLTFSGKAENLTFTGTAYGLEGVDDTIVFDDFSGKFNGSIREVETITISGDTNLELGRRQTKTAETGLKFVVDDTTVTSDAAMYIVRDKNRWEFAESITIDASAAVTGTYLLVDNYAGSFDGFTFSGATLNEYVADGDVRYMLSVNANNQLVLDVSAATIGNTTVTSGESVDFSAQTIQSGADGKALAISHADVETETDIVFNNTTVEGNITTGNNKNKVEFTASGNTTVNGDISGSAGLVDFTVADGKTTINGQISSAIGNDSLKVSDNAELEVESVSTGTSDDNIELAQGAKMTVSNNINTGTDDDNITLGQESVVSSKDIICGTGDDIITIGENATLNAQVISGGNGQDTLILKKGAMVNVYAVETTEYMEINVDAVLNPTDDYTWSTKPVTVTGITELNTDVAGAKMIFANCGADKAVKFDNVDTVLGTATQIAGADTTADASDDVWASLSKVDGDLVVAWGRNETELDAALKAFKDDSTLTLGQAVVADAASLAADGVSVADFKDKKDNGQLA